MVNKRTKTKRESLLSKRVYSENFVLAYDFIDECFGIFFGISAKSVNPVKRNSIKRFFRELIKEELINKGFEKEGVPLSICLISKKGISLDADISNIKEELRGLVRKINKKI